MSTSARTWCSMLPGFTAQQLGELAVRARLMQAEPRRCAAAAGGECPSAGKRRSVDILASDLAQLKATRLIDISQSLVQTGPMKRANAAAAQPEFPLVVGRRRDQPAGLAVHASGAPGARGQRAARHRVEVGFLNAAQTAAFLLVGLPAGAWVDRMLKRRVMITADLVRAVALAAVPILWFSGALQVWHLYIVAAVVGCGDGVLRCLVPELPAHPSAAATRSGARTPSSRRPLQVARIGGLGIAGGLLAIVSAPVLVTIDSVSYLVSDDRDLAHTRRGERQATRPSGRALEGRDRRGPAIRLRPPAAAPDHGDHCGTNLFGTIATTLLPPLMLRTLGLNQIALGINFGVGPRRRGQIGAIATPWITKRIG